MTILDKIKVIARDVLDVNMDDITEETHIYDDLGVDERVAYELYSKAQDAFPGLTATAKEAMKLKTIGDLVAFVRAKVGESEF